MRNDFEELITLKQGPWQMQLLPRCGTSVLSLSYDGRQILRAPEDAQQLFQKPVLYGIPLLLPANRVKDARFLFQGREYVLPMNEPVRSNHIHGFLSSAPFQVESVTENSVTTSIENTGAYYPFPFRIVMDDCLTERGLTRTLTLTNTGTADMPYTLAYHTTFVEPTYFQIPLGQRFPTDERYIPDGSLVALTEREREFRDGTSPKGDPISGFFTSAGNTAVVDEFRFVVSEQFDQWILFNGNGQQGYLCIEPQCGEVNGLNTNGHRVLAPGEKEIFWIKIEKEF